MANNRFTIQILGNVDYADYASLQAKLLEVLGTINGFKVTTCNLTAWQDGNGKLREFNDDGTEIVANTVTEPEIKTDEIEVTTTEEPTA